MFLAVMEHRPTEVAQDAADASHPDEQGHGEDEHQSADRCERESGNFMRRVGTEAPAAQSDAHLASPPFGLDAV